MKKLLSLILVLIMVCSVSSTAFAHREGFGHRNPIESYILRFAGTFAIPQDLKLRSGFLYTGLLLVRICWASLGLLSLIVFICKFCKLSVNAAKPLLPSILILYYRNRKHNFCCILLNNSS